MIKAKMIFKILIPAVCFAAFFVQPANAKKINAKHRWKIATLAPDGVGWAKHIKGIVLPGVKKATDGNLAIKVYWGGVMGDDEDFIRKMRVGQIQGAGLTGQGATLLCPEMSVVELPFLFNNYKEVDYIKKKMTATFDGLMRERNVFLLAWVDQDFDQLYSTRGPLKNLQQISRATFFTWNGPLEEAMLKALGAKQIPVEVPKAAAMMREGAADAAIAPALWMVGTQLYTMLKFVNPTKIRYTPSLIVVETRDWDALPEQYQEKILTIRGALRDKFCKEVRADNIKSLKAMINYGVKETAFSEKDLAAAKKATRHLWNSMADKLYPRELLDEVMAYLAEFRGESTDLTRKTWSAKTDSSRPAVAGTIKKKPGIAAPKIQQPEKSKFRAMSRAQKKEMVKKVQTILKKDGFYTMRVDGIPGPRTFWGIKRYQKNRGLAVTGRIDNELIKAMGL